jgi:large subunit ribosomal protein L15
LKAKKEKNDIKMLSIGGLHPAHGSKKKRKRVGRGTSSGHGKTSCRGHKGQKSRSGGVKRPGFEGGQTPIYRRLPKINRFSNIGFKRSFSIVNLSDLSKLKADATLVDMMSAGFLKEGEKLKVLGGGDIKRAMTVEAHGFSGSAKKKIEAAGGKAVKI